MIYIIYPPLRIIYFFIPKYEKNIAHLILKKRAPLPVPGAVPEDSSPYPIAITGTITLRPRLPFIRIRPKLWVPVTDLTVRVTVNVRDALGLRVDSWGLASIAMEGGPSSSLWRRSLRSLHWWRSVSRFESPPYGRWLWTASWDCTGSLWCSWKASCRSSLSRGCQSLASFTGIPDNPYNLHCVFIDHEENEVSAGQCINDTIKLQASNKLPPSKMSPGSKAFRGLTWPLP